MRFKPAATKVELTTSYEMYIVSNGKRRQIGGIQKINPKESRDVNRSFEIGSVNASDPGEAFEIYPGVVNDVSLSVERLKFYKKNMLEAVGSDAGAETLRDQNIPFDIEEVIKIPAFRADGTPDPDADNATVKTKRIFQECYISELSDSKDITGDLRITESATIVCRRIITK